MECLQLHLEIAVGLIVPWACRSKRDGCQRCDGIPVDIDVLEKEKQVMSHDSDTEVSPG